MVICCGFYWRLTLSTEYTWIDSHDLVHMEAPRFQFQARQWHLGKFPLWDPHQWCGQPFLGELTGAANPVNWPFFWLPLRKSGRMGLDIMNWYYVLIHCLGGLFAYWLCRDLKRSRAASLMGALIFALGGFFSSAAWPEIMGGYLWAPLVFLFLLRVLRGYREAASAAWCGLFLGAAWLSGHHEFPIYLSFTVAALWIYRMVSAGPSRARLLRLAALALLIAILTSGFQTVPGYEYAKLAERWVGTDLPVGWQQPVPYAIDTAYSYHPGSLVNLFVPYLASDSSDYLGVVALVLALTGVLACWRRGEVRLFTAVGLSGLLLAMSAYNVFHGMAYAVLPLFGKARNPQRLLSLFSIAAAPLAAYGLDALRARAGTRWLRGVIIALVGVGGGAYAVALADGIVHQYSPNQYVMFAALIALLLSGVLAAWRKNAVGARFLTAALMALVLAELAVVDGTFAERDKGFGASATDLTAYDDIARYLHAQPGLARIDFQNSFNFGDWYGIDSLIGFGAGVTSNLLQLERGEPRVQDLLGVTYTVAKASRGPEQVLVFRGASGFNVYRNPGAFPRVWTVHQTAMVPSAVQLRAAMADPGFDMRATALMLGSAPPLNNCAQPDAPAITSRDADSMTIQTRMGCRGMLVIADTWYPGWYAAVDDRPAPIYEAYGALRGIVVEQGMHKVTMRYRPRSALLGGIMSVAGIILACAVGLGLRPPGGDQRIAL